MKWIECKYGGSKQRVFLNARPITIGRSETADLSFPNDKGVSRNHAQIELRGKHWCVVDTGSTNGTFVNGQKVTVPHPLREGDVIVTGEQWMHIHEWMDSEERAIQTAEDAGHYRTLRIPLDATQDEIKAAYLELAAALDPDHHPGAIRIRELRAEIDAAYEVLGDPATRAAYDASLVPETEF